MENKTSEQLWSDYRQKELAGVTPRLKAHGFILEPLQIHVGGERFLMSGKKLVLIGKREADQKRVIIKASSDSSGIREITAERNARETLRSLKFAYHQFFEPEELFYRAEDGYLILITEYIEQKLTFLERPLEEQFTLALRALKTQEGVHATTYSHAREIEHSFGSWNAASYIHSFQQFISRIKKAAGEKQLIDTLTEASRFLEINQKTLDQYGGFLTHTDFVPHNLRISGDTIYLLDHSSIHFGNKYESWARFTNFMLLHNPKLEEALVSYVRQNRTLEETLSLRLMRIYKIGFLLQFYTEAIEKTVGNLRELSRKRVTFWTAALHSLVHDIPLDVSVRDTYLLSRKELQSAEEKVRQEKLH